MDNGKLDPATENLSRFTRLANAGRKALWPQRQAERAAQPTEAELRAGKLREWARDDVCASTFLPYLTGKISYHEALEQDNLEAGNGPLQDYHKGRKDALRDLRADFSAWRDKA